MCLLWIPSHSNDPDEKLEEGGIYGSSFQSRDIKYNCRIQAFQDHKYKRGSKTRQLQHTVRSLNLSSPGPKTPLKLSDNDDDFKRKINCWDNKEQVGLYSGDNKEHVVCTAGTTRNMFVQRGEQVQEIWRQIVITTFEGEMGKCSWHQVTTRHAMHISTDIPTYNRHHLIWLGEECHLLTQGWTTSGPQGKYLRPSVTPTVRITQCL